MRSFSVLAAAILLGAAAPAFAQGPAAEAPTADPAQQRAVDEAYRGRCEAKAPKELCLCVISVADTQLAEPDERQVFYDFMMGDVDKAQTARAMFGDRKKIKFNVSLQKADVMLGERCDRLKPQPKDQPAPGGEKLP